VVWMIEEVGMIEVAGMIEVEIEVLDRIVYLP
jgi:hypothetical protein